MFLEVTQSTPSPTTRLNTEFNIEVVRDELGFDGRHWRQSVDRFALCFRADMAVVLSHLSRDVPSNAQIILTAPRITVTVARTTRSFSSVTAAILIRFTPSCLVSRTSPRICSNCGTKIGKELSRAMN
jgi:hypothetical protein